MAISLIVGLGVGAPASAHDYWLTPATFYPKPGSETAMRLYVGDRYVVEAERTFQRDATTTMSLVAWNSIRDLIPKTGDDLKPLCTFAMGQSGSVWFRLDRAPRLITLKGAKFTEYLNEEGLESIIERRKHLGESEKDGRERYRRCLKCYLAAGESNTDLFRKPLGQKLEIVPQSDPAKLVVGDSLEVTVLLDGKPLSGAKVSSLTRDGDKVREQSATTTKDGSVTIRISNSGAWLVRLVHMERGHGKEADWESYWAAMSFGVKDKQ